ncbi:MAG: NADH-quinone oxidoreductase subunit I [Chloroflexi bacterium]|nr:NADH-quinone oxidoreductase subunit I [Chloroflexota bacterium]
MLASLKGLLVTLKTTLRRPVTAQYPKEHLPVQPRYMGFPALTWDEQVQEPFCTGCMVCVRNCPTQCMSAEMADNPRFKEGKSPRRKTVKSFAINLNRCILCSICVEVCNFDAIVMSHEHELSTFSRDGRRVGLEQLLEMGKRYQGETGWQPPSKAKPEPPKAPAAAGKGPVAAAAQAGASAPTTGGPA